MVREIKLTRDKIAFVDDDDYEIVTQSKWYAQRCRKFNWYAKRARFNEGKKQVEAMHHLILGCGFIDHINGNGLDNRKENLRFVTNQENTYNQRKRPGTSQYKGVCWDKESGKWLVQIQVDGRRKKIGRFDDELVAALAWDEAARIYYKGFAAVNFPINKERGALC